MIIPAIYIHRVIEYVPALIFIVFTYLKSSALGEVNLHGLALVVVWARYCMQILDKFGLVQALFGMELLQGIERGHLFGQKK